MDTTTWPIVVLARIGNPRPVATTGCADQTRGKSLRDGFAARSGHLWIEGKERLCVIEDEGDEFAWIFLTLPAPTHADAVATATALAADAFTTAEVDVAGFGVLAAPTFAVLATLLSPDDRKYAFVFEPIDA